MEQPKALAEAFRGRINEQESTLRLGGLEGLPIESMGAAKRIIIAACGTSFHSGLVGEYLIESMARIPVEVEYASEFRYRNPILTPTEDILIVISQSGETADTLAAVNLAKQVGIMTIGLVNVVGSTIARETHAGCYLHVGPEIGVASTKAFTGQVALLAMLALRLGIERKLLSDEQIVSSISGLARIPEQMDQVLQQASVIENLAKSYRFASSFLYLGRGFNFPVALEGALKLKEISYIHAEGYAAAEMKHGPIALIDKFMPVVIIAPPSDTTYDKIRSNVEEVHARGGNVIIITEVGNEDFKSKAEATLYIPKCPEWLSPLLTVVPLQLLSYYIATMRKLDVDQPRNLAKSVTVE
jgi:glucosamine--fructose-6-phosphate aminotransferase (isomerizing)